jgi:hypothetical protein
MMFFVSSRVALSLWLFVILWQLPRVIGLASGGNPDTVRSPVQFGALIAFAVMIIWAGRAHYGRVIRLMFTRQREGEDDTRFFVHHRTAGWMALLGVILAVAWLVNASMPLLPAVLLVLMMLTIWMVMANVMAQSGLLIANTTTAAHEWFARGWLNTGGLSNLQTFSPADVKTQYFAQMIGGTWAYNSDHLSAYATAGAKQVDATLPGSTSRAATGRALLGAIVLALVVGFIVSLSSNLLLEYNFQYTADARGAMINREIVEGNPKWGSDFAAATLTRGQSPSLQPQNLWTILAGSAIVTGVLAFLQLRYASWPLHPIGLLMCFSPLTARLVSSLFIGWLVTRTILWLGGAKLYRDARPLFIGVIVGEVLAAGLMALLNTGLYFLGVPFQSMPMLPNSQF